MILISIMIRDGTVPRLHCGVEVFVMSEGELMYYDMNFSNPPKKLDLQGVEDSFLVSLSNLRWQSSTLLPNVRLRTFL